MKVTCVKVGTHYTFEYTKINFRTVLFNTSFFSPPLAVLVACGRKFLGQGLDPTHSSDNTDPNPLARGHSHEVVSDLGENFLHLFVLDLAQ